MYWDHIFHVKKMPKIKKSIVNCGEKVSSISYKCFEKNFVFQVVVFYLTFYIEEIVLFSLCNQGLNTYHHIGTSICVFIFFKDSNIYNMSQSDGWWENDDHYDDACYEKKNLTRV